MIIVGSLPALWKNIYSSLSSPWYVQLSSDQVDSWEDELAANAEDDEHSGVLNQIVKDRELATKVVNKQKPHASRFILLTAVLKPSFFLL